MSTSTPDEINIKKLRNRPGNPLACDNWIESLYSIAAVRYGQHASFFTTGKLFLMVGPVPRAGLDEMATTSAAWKLHNSRIEAFVKWERDSSDVAAKLFGLMWQNLSAESQTLVARVPPATGWTKKKLAMETNNNVNKKQHKRNRRRVRPARERLAVKNENDSDPRGRD